MADETRQRLVGAMSRPLDYTLADFLQDRGPNRLMDDPDRSMWWATPPNALTPPANMLAPYAAPVSEFTTPGDTRRERISSMFGWDVGPGGWHPAYALQEFNRRAGTTLPLAIGRLPGAPAMPMTWMQRLGIPQDVEKAATQASGITATWPMVDDDLRRLRAMGLPGLR